MTNPNDFVNDLLPNPELGVRNLLFNCAGMQPGDSLLVLAEDASHGFYSTGLSTVVADAARGLGLQVEVINVDFDANRSPDVSCYEAAMSRHDRTLFLARVGDQLRFNPTLEHLRPIVCYALDLNMLSAGFGLADHRGLLRLKGLIDDAIAFAAEVRLTCPFGTDVRSGSSASRARTDTSVTRFPLSVFTPVLADGFRGRIAQTGFLIGTGAHYYSPYWVDLEDTLFVTLKDSRITAFEGSDRDVAVAEAHYKSIGDSLGIDPWHVHSWHGGMHPGCAYVAPAADNLERWSGGAFGNPRLMHFHTCGAEPPGEISLNIIDPTLWIDGQAVWEAGRLRPERLVGGAELLEDFPCLGALFAAPSPEIGIGHADRLPRVVCPSQVHAE